MTFDGMRYPVEAYCRAIESAGLLIESLREPAPADPGYDGRRWSAVPVFLLLRALKPPL